MDQKQHLENNDKKNGTCKKKYSKLKNIGSILKSGAIIFITCLSSNAMLRYYGKAKNNDYLSENKIFEVGKVDNTLDFYGGDERYIERTLNMFTECDNTMYNHFNTGDNSCIKVGISNQFSQQEKDQINIFYNYLNDVFKVINPSYNFVVGDFSKAKSAIYICKESLPALIGAQCFVEKDFFVNSCIEKANIHINQNLTLSNQAFKIYLAHEMMHVLLGSDDINYKQSRTVSVYNYDDCAYMINQIENALEEEQSGVFTVYPTMTKEEKDTFVTYTPVDIATLVAVYGQNDSLENKKKYVELIKQTLDNCSKVYGDYQPYFDKSFNFKDLTSEFFDDKTFSE